MLLVENAKAEKSMGGSTTRSAFSFYFGEYDLTAEFKSIAIPDIRLDRYPIAADPAYTQWQRLFQQCQAGIGI